MTKCVRHKGAARSVTSSGGPGATLYVSHIPLFCCSSDCTRQGLQTRQIYAHLDLPDPGNKYTADVQVLPGTSRGKSVRRDLTLPIGVSFGSFLSWINLWAIWLVGCGMMPPDTPGQMSQVPTGHTGQRVPGSGSLGRCLKCTGRPLREAGSACNFTNKCGCTGRRLPFPA